MKKSHCLPLLLALAAGFGPAPVLAQNPDPFQLVRGAGELRVMAFINSDGQLPAPENLSPEMRVRAVEGGLQFDLQAGDDSANQPVEGELLKGDSWEIFLSRAPEGNSFLQLAVARVGDDVRVQAIKSPVDDAESAVTLEQLEDGMAVTVPWSVFGGEGSGEEEFFLQVQFNDFDEGKEKVIYRWYPSGDTWKEPRRAWNISVTEEAQAAESAPHFALAGLVENERFRRLHLTAVAPAEMAGQPVTALLAGEVVATGVFEESDSGARARMSLPFPEFDQRDAPLQLRTESGEIGAVSLGVVVELVQKKMRWNPLRFLPFVFKGDSFPEADFFNPTEMDVLQGPFKIGTTYFDANHTEVTEPTEPGRYGAVTKATLGDGSVLTRNHTLFRQPHDAPVWQYSVETEFRFDEPLGITPETWAAEKRAVNEIGASRIRAGFIDDPGLAILLAGLHEKSLEGGEAAEVTLFNDVFAQDRRYWLPLKLKLYGLTPEPLNRPKQVDGEPAPVLEEMSETAENNPLGEAGLTKIDEFLRTWEQDAELPLALCLVLDGRVVFHRVYGEKEGRPAELTDTFFMASLTKLLAGTAVMMLVDEGRLELDVSIGEYLPPFRDVELPRPITLRHLLTHTAGMSGHEGDKLPDFPERMAEIAQELPVGRTFIYNGNSYELAGKIVELQTGEIIPDYLTNHLLAPLGMERTQVRNMNGHAFGNAGEMARFGQMLLNGGRYGDQLFLSEDAIRQMVPQPLTVTMGAGTKNQWGLGMMPYHDEPLGLGVMGHNAASGAIFRVDPKRNLVVSLMRDEPGEDQKARAAELLKLLAELVPAQD